MDLSIFRNIKSPYVLVLVGPPLSGKSTFVRRFKDEIDSSFKLISRDDIVLDLYGGSDYNKAFKSIDQKEANRILIKRMQEYSSNKSNVIIDMTHMSSKTRKYHLSFFSDYYKVAVIFPILSDQEYELRNIKRTEEENKTIPNHVLKSMISSYQSIKEVEGFDKVLSL